MGNIQFRTNLIEWGKMQDGEIRPINAYTLKDINEYGSELAILIATSLIPDMISFASAVSFDHFLEEYEEYLENGNEDILASIIPNDMSLTNDEMNAARILYVKFSNMECPDDNRNISAESLMKAYFSSPDVSKMNSSELESVFIHTV